MPPTADPTRIVDWELIKDPVLKGRYEICREGYIRNRKTLHVMTTWDDKNGYPHVSLNVDKSRSFAIHRLMGFQFVENTNPEKFNIVHHKDENIKNWNIDNLEWTDQKGNMKAHVAHRKKAGKVVTKLRKVLYKVVQYDKNMNQIKIWNSVDDIIAAHPDYNRDSISGTCTYSHPHSRGFVWRYMDEAGTIITKDYVPPCLPGEVFKTIGVVRGHDLSSFKVSNFGRLFNSRGQFLQPNIKKKYPEIAFRVKNKSFSFCIHILVAEVFVEGKSEERKEVNHENKDTRDFRAVNLRWVTPAENKQHATGIIVEQLNDDGEVLQTFGSLLSAAKHVEVDMPMSARYRIELAIKTNSKTYGFLWRFKEITI